MRRSRARAHEPVLRCHRRHTIVYLLLSSSSSKFVLYQWTSNNTYNWLRKRCRHCMFGTREKNSDRIARWVGRFEANQAEITVSKPEDSHNLSNSLLQANAIRQIVEQLLTITCHWFDSPISVHMSAIRRQIWHSWAPLLTLSKSKTTFVSQRWVLVISFISYKQTTRTSSFSLLSLPSLTIIGTSNVPIF